MKILEFIFKLLWQFIQFEPGRFSELKDKAAAWQKVQDETKEEDRKWYHKLLKYDNEWWFQVAMAIFFLFAFKSVRAWLMADPMAGGDDDDDNDDDGEDDVPVNSKAKLSPFAGFKF